MTDSFGQSVTSAAAALTFGPGGTTTIAAPASACPGAAGLTASVPPVAGATYAWAITGGSITAGSGTSQITFTAGASGSVHLDVTVTDTAACVVTGSKDISINGGACGGGSYFTVAPCRVADTRNPPGPSGGPPLAANHVRSFPVTGICGIPPTAKAVAVNLAVFFPDSDGDLRVYPTGGAAPLASSINFRPGIVRANNAIVPIGAGGQISVQCDMASPTGSTNFFFDVFGYFE